MKNGDDMKTTDRTLHALRPAALDELAEDAHARNRDADLARIMRAAPEPAGRRARARRPVLLLAGAAAAACAVTGAVAIAGDGGGTAPDTPAPVARGPVDARTFLLASAETARKAPDEIGRYWYTRTREQRFGDRRLGGETRFPFVYRYTTTLETWHATRRGDPSRTILGAGTRPDGFPTKEDEAAWKRAGSPEVIAPGYEPAVQDYGGDDIPVFERFGGRRITLAELRELPAAPERLGAMLRDQWEKERGTYAEEDLSYSSYAFGQVAHLLTRPVASGTKAALYRLLADLPEVRSKGRTADPLGRPGVAVSMKGTNLDGPYEATLIIDPGTADLLADTVQGGWTTYAETGWTGRLGERP